jgi:hypothetical protein
LLDTLDKRLRIEFSEARRDLEQPFGLRSLLNVPNGDSGAIFHLDSQREFEVRVDPANDVPSGG